MGRQPRPRARIFGTLRRGGRTRDVLWHNALFHDTIEFPRNDAGAYSGGAVSPSLSSGDCLDNLFRLGHAQSARPPGRDLYRREIVHAASAERYRRYTGPAVPLSMAAANLAPASAH